MIDANQKIVNAVSFDVSAVLTAAGVSTTLASYLGTATALLASTLKEGLPMGAMMTVLAAGTGTLSAPVNIELEYCVDGGTVWNKAGVATVKSAALPTLTTTNIGLIDIKPEMYAESLLGIRVRAYATASNGTTIDPTWSVWLGREKNYN